VSRFTVITGGNRTVARREEARWGAVRNPQDLTQQSLIALPNQGSPSSSVDSLKDPNHVGFQGHLLRKKKKNLVFLRSNRDNFEEFYFFQATL
jgi:hypothetical protein